MNLTPAQAGQFESWKKIVYEYRKVSHEWIQALFKIKESGYWRKEAKSWEQWCDEHAGRSAASLRMIEYRERQKQGRRLIAQTTAEPEPEPAKEKNTQKVIDVSAKVYPNALSYTMESPAEAAPMVGKGDPRDLHRIVAELVKSMESMSRNRLFASDAKFKEAFILARQAAGFLSMELPGIVETLDPQNTPKRKGTLAQVLLYCSSLGLSERDAHWFFDKQEGCGWKINGRAIADWQAVARTWKTSAIFPSQKSNDQNTQRSFAGGAGQARSLPDYSKGF